LYDGRSGQKPETIKYAPHTGPTAKQRAKKFLKLDTVKETKEDGCSVNEPSDSNTRQNHDEENVIPETQAEEDVEIPELSLAMTIGLLVVVTILVAVTAEWLVDSIDGLANTGGISKEFIGLILLPIVGNAAEHVSAVTVSIKDKLTLSISVAVGSSIVSFLLLFRRDMID
jgi:Ca2+:H+ antiporter